jgi:hypothetical protein
MPGASKYSLLAKKVIFLGTAIGKKIESEKDRWLLARIAGPFSGTLLSPSIHG